MKFLMHGEPRSDVNNSTWLITSPIPLTGSDLLHFAIRGSGGSYSLSNYLALDTVSVTSAVPEPASALLLAAGLGGVALLRRRQQRRAD